MFQPMESWNEGYRSYQRALRSPMRTLEQAISWAERRATGKPFVCCGVTVVWSK